MILEEEINVYMYFKFIHIEKYMLQSLDKIKLFAIYYVL